MEIKSQEQIEKFVTESVAYLNSVTGSNYRDKTVTTFSLLKRLYHGGYTLDDVKAVIDMKFTEWTGTEFEKYLRPSTLFRSNNFENYIGTLGNPSEREELLSELVAGARELQNEEIEMVLEYITKIQGVTDFGE